EARSTGRASIAGDPCEARSTGRASIAGDPCEARSTGRASIAGDPCEARSTGLELHYKLKEVLAHLANLGVALDACHHFTPERCYEMVHRMVNQETLHPDSPRSGYIVHYLTFEQCETCRAEELGWEQDQRIESDEDATEVGGR
ncbi:MAG: hypothetical protein KDB14_13085, partial [Planctomycetales bacterium]|nr:hypothetical protein [Planctomycetales bacterium]